MQPNATPLPPVRELAEELPDLAEEDNELEPGAAALPPELERLGLRIEREYEEEDDFTDGRSSAGTAMRAEQDSWNRLNDWDERPFDEPDVPPRAELGPDGEYDEEVPAVEDASA